MFYWKNHWSRESVNQFKSNEAQSWEWLILWPAAGFCLCASFASENLIFYRKKPYDYCVTRFSKPSLLTLCNFMSYLLLLSWMSFFFSMLSVCQRVSSFTNVSACFKISVVFKLDPLCNSTMQFSFGFNEAAACLLVTPTVKSHSSSDVPFTETDLQSSF